MFKSSRVRIPSPDTRWNIFHIYLCKKLFEKLFEKTKSKQKTGMDNLKIPFCLKLILKFL